MSSDDDAVFASTAEYYAAYRPGYPERAFEYLAERFGLDGTGRALDLGCGTGEIALPLSSYVDSVLAMDPSESMLAAGRRRAEAAGRSSVEWRVGSDADLSGDLGAFRLATMGRSFHWMDQERTLDRLFGLIRPGGGVALFGNSEWLVRGTREWQDEVYAAAEAHVDELPERTGPVEYDDPWDEKLAAFGFADVEKLTVSVDREWTVEEVVGYVFSLSYCSPEAVGDSREALEAEVCDRLAAMDRDAFGQEDDVTVISGRRPPGE